jgi:methyl-accepting chemotaxis protein
MRRHAEEMHGVAGRTQAEAKDVADAAARAAESLGAVATEAEAMVTTVTALTGEVGTASDAAAQAVADASAASDLVVELRRSAEEIGGVISIIDEIASKTNLLALNATNDAARAGEAGKGFAVVASEVKGLAGQTARAAEDVGRRIGAVRSTTADVADALGRVAEAIGRVDRIAAAVADAMTAQGQSIARFVAEVQAASGQTRSTSASMSSVRAAAESAAESASAMSGAVDRVADETAALKKDIDTFVARTDQGERRSQDRHAFAGEVTLSWAGKAEQAGAVDISEGGLLVRGALSCALGQRVTVTLPRGQATVLARVARHDGDDVGLLFMEDEATHGTVRRIIASLTAMPARAA